MHKKDLINSSHTIIINKFSHKSADYYKKDILHNILRIKNIHNKKDVRELKKKKKKELFNLLCDIINDFNKYKLSDIIKIQSYFRKYLNNYSLQ